MVECEHLSTSVLLNSAEVAKVEPQYWACTGKVIKLLLTQIGTITNTSLLCCSVYPISTFQYSDLYRAYGRSKVTQTDTFKWKGNFQYKSPALWCFPEANYHGMQKCTRSSFCGVLTPVQNLHWCTKWYNWCMQYALRAISDQNYLCCIVTYVKVLIELDIIFSVQVSEKPLDLSGLWDGSLWKVNEIFSELDVWLWPCAITECFFPVLQPICEPPYPHYLPHVAGAFPAPGRQDLCHNTTTQCLKWQLMFTKKCEVCRCSQVWNSAGDQLDLCKKEPL